jgi:hypothetical protein
MAAVAAAGGVVAGPGAAAAGADADAGAGAEGGVTGVGSSNSVALVSADGFFATGGDVDGGAAFLAVGGDVAVAGVPFGGGVSDGIKRSAILDSEDFTPLGEGCSAEVGLSPSSFFELRRKENMVGPP